MKINGSVLFKRVNLMVCESYPNKLLKNQWPIHSLRHCEVGTRFSLTLQHRKLRLRELH